MPDVYMSGTEVLVWGSAWFSKASHLHCLPVFMEKPIPAGPWVPCDCSILLGQIEAVIQPRSVAEHLPMYGSRCMRKNVVQMIVWLGKKREDQTGRLLAFAGWLVRTNWLPRTCCQWMYLSCVMSTCSRMSLCERLRQKMNGYGTPLRLDSTQYMSLHSSLLLISPCG